MAVLPGRFMVSLDGVGLLERDSEPQAIFEGTLLALNAMAIQRDGGNFGLSVGRQADGSLAGRIVGRSGGTIKVTPPVGFDASRCQVKLNGTVKAGI